MPVLGGTFSHFILTPSLSAMKIHITHDTKEILDELGGFITECRGFVEIKVSSLASSPLLFI
jgi:hypothetical protein